MAIDYSERLLKQPKRMNFLRQYLFRLTPTTKHLQRLCFDLVVENLLRSLVKYVFLIERITLLADRLFS